MFWTVFGIIIFVVATGSIVYLNIRDRRYEKKSVVEAMGDRVWDELSAEREASIERARRFRKVMEEAKKKG